MNVRLYCDRHDRVHELPADQVERLVYALQFAAAERGPATERPEGGRRPLPQCRQRGDQHEHPERRAPVMGRTVNVAALVGPE